MSEVVAATSTRVPEQRRMGFLPRWLGRKHFLRGEQLVYAFAERLSVDYRGAYWHFYDCANGACFMAPKTERTFATSWSENNFSATLSAEAFGIVACLFALGYLANSTADEAIVNQYHALREFACDHPEAGKILAAID